MRAVDRWLSEAVEQHGFCLQLSVFVARNSAKCNCGIVVKRRCEGAGAENRSKSDAGAARRSRLKDNLELMARVSNSIQFHHDLCHDPCHHSSRINSQCCSPSAGSQFPRHSHRTHPFQPLQRHTLAAWPRIIRPQLIIHAQPVCRSQ